MNIRLTNRNFRIIEHEIYADSEHKKSRLVQESSAIGDYADSWDNPGSSFLWIGQDHHLNREEIGRLIEELQYWLDKKRLRML